MKWLVYAALAFLLSACSVREVSPPEWQSHREQVERLDDWSFMGRMAVKVQDNARAGGQVNVDWSQASEVSAVRLSGPFGSGAVDLVWKPDSVVMADRNGERAIEYTGPDAAADFMQAELGWVFPADGIRYWVRGLPDPEGTSVRWWTDDGGLAGLEQYGWRIEYESYGQFENYVLPVKMNVTGHGARLRIIVSRWNVDGAES